MTIRANRLTRERNMTELPHCTYWKIFRLFLQTISVTSRNLRLIETVGGQAYSFFERVTWKNKWEVYPSISPYGFHSAICQSKKPEHDLTSFGPFQIINFWLKNLNLLRIVTDINFVRTYLNDAQKRILTMHSCFKTQYSTRAVEVSLSATSTYLLHSLRSFRNGTYSLLKDSPTALVL